MVSLLSRTLYHCAYVTGVKTGVSFQYTIISSLACVPPSF